MADTRPEGRRTTLRDMLKGQGPIGGLGRASAGAQSKILLDQLEPNPWQYRSPDPEWIEELAASIAAKGQLEAITYRTSAEGKKQIIGGHSRWGALKLLRDRAATPEEKVRYGEILANEKLNVSDDEMFEFALIDNLFRKDPSLVDTARGLAEYQERAHLSVPQLAERFSLEADRVKRLLALHRAPEVIKLGVGKGVMVQLYDDDGRPLATEARDGKPARPKREHRNLDLMAALELSSLHAYLEKHAPKRAARRVEELVTEALEQGWTFRRVQDACHRERERARPMTSESATTDREPGGAGEESSPASTATSPRPLFRADEKQVVIFRSRLEESTEEARAPLRALLTDLLATLT